MTYPAPHIEHGTHGIESPAPRHHLQDVDIPPMVSCTIKMLGRVSCLPPKLVAHEIPSRSRTLIVTPPTYPPTPQSPNRTPSQRVLTPPPPWKRACKTAMMPL